MCVCMYVSISIHPSTLPSINPYFNNFFFPFSTIPKLLFLYSVPEAPWTSDVYQENLFMEMFINLTINHFKAGEILRILVHIS